VNATAKWSVDRDIENVRSRERVADHRLKTGRA
jgi:hypothetical protein